MAAGADAAAASGSTATRTPDLSYAAVAAGAAVMGVAEGPRTPLVLVCLALALVPWALLVTRRSLPLGLFAVLSIVPLVPVVLSATHVGGALFLTTAASSWIASRAGRPALVAATTAAAVALPLLPLVAPRGSDDVGSVYFAFGNVLGVLVGLLVHRATRLADELRAADARLSEAATREERHRIARDVHDLVAHSLTVVVLHVGGARRVLRADPTAAEGALADAERVCRESLDGIRGVVGLLRDDDAPPRVLSLDLAELVEGYRAAGLPVVERTTGDAASLPLAVRVTLHRVVQEALANAARHAVPGTPVAVDVAVAETGVVARITNERPTGAAPAARSTGGYGLLGLGERVAALGGDLSSGPRGSTWVVACRLPLTPAPTPGPRTPTAALSGGGA